MLFRFVPVCGVGIISPCLSPPLCLSPSLWLSLVVVISVYPLCLPLGVSGSGFGLKRRPHRRKRTGLGSLPESSVAEEEGGEGEEEEGEEEDEEEDAQGTAGARKAAGPVRRA